MGRIEIEGGHRLSGEVKVQGSKNATLPIMAATLLNSGISIIKNFPDIEDVRQMQKLLVSLGCRITVDDDDMIVDSQPASDALLPAEITGKIRASSVLLGPMLARFHHVKMAQPGGCRIGSRPLDIHMNVFKAFGASWELSEDYIEVSCVHLHPAQIRLSKKSVGATENAIMTASLIKGRSRITNAAMEPEIITLCEYLKNTGVMIQVDDRDTIIVEGGACSHGAIVIPGDRIVAGTYMGAVTACGGNVTITGMRLAECRGFLNVFTGMGLRLEAQDTESCTVRMDGRPACINCVQTAPYPGFPTDMQSIVMACAAQADGVTSITEKIFDHRMTVADQLNRMGADISVVKNCALVKGVSHLKGNTVHAEDLRGAAALVIAGMAAEGVTSVEHYEYLNRGYYRLCEILNRLGANIHVK